MIIDILFLIIAGYGFWIGFNRGIIKTIFMVLSISFGVMAALRFTPAMTNFLKDLFNETSPLMFVAGLLSTFLLTMMFLRLLGRGLEGILESVNINIINQLLGGMVMAAIATLLYSMVVWFVVESTVDRTSPTVVESRTYPLLKDYPKTVWSVAGRFKPIVQDFWQYSKDILDQVENVAQRADSENYFYDLPDDEDKAPNDQPPR